MEQLPSTQILIQVDGRTIVARPRPEDEVQLADLIAGGSTFSITQSNLDTEGHGLSDEIFVDVEGHAMTLRLPNAGDAAALRRALAVGALAASFALGGAVVSTLENAAPVAPAAPIVAPAAIPAQASELETLREQRLAPAEAPAGPAVAPAVPVAAPVAAPVTGQPVDLPTLRENRLSEAEAPSGPVDGSATDTSTGVQDGGTQGGPLEFDR